jgi:MFS family permease
MRIARLFNSVSDMKPDQLHPNIHRLILSQAVSKLGDNFTEVALALFVLALTHQDVAALGLVLAMVYVPNVALGWLVTGMIDRVDKRTVLVAADLIRAALVASIPLIHTYSWTVVAVFLMYTCSAAYRPSLRGVQPQVAGSPAILRRSGARQQAYYSMADIGSYLAAAAVIFLWGLTPAFWIDAATYLGASILVLAIRVPAEVWRPHHAAAARFSRQLAEGYQYVRDHAIVAQLTIISAAATFGVGALNTFTAPLSQSVWHVSSHHYVWLVLAMAIGGLVSGGVLEKYALMDRWGFRTLIGLGFALTGIGYGLTVAMPTWWAGWGLFLAVGFGNGLFGTAVVTWVQQVAPDHIRARVLSVRGVGLGAGGALGAWLGGLMAVHLGLAGAIVVVGCFWIALTAWVWTAPALRVGHKRGSAA